MKKERRIKKAEEFREISHKAEKTVSALYVVYFFPKKEALNRIGISVSKKLGNAVVRNRIKRQVRNIINETNALALDADLIVIVRKGYDPDDYASSKKCFQTTLKHVTINKYHKGEDKNEVS